MMTMNMSPYNRAARRRRHAHYHGTIAADVHIPLNIHEEDDVFVITALIPGLEAEDVQIEVLENRVAIFGEFNSQLDEETEFLREEIPTGKFRRVVRLSTKLDAAKAEAALTNGILTLSVPKVEEARPKTIQIKAK